MVLYRANDRHVVDKRILRITDIDEFKLWREKDSLGINGLIYTWPETTEKLQTAADELATVSHHRRLYSMSKSNLCLLKKNLTQDGVNNIIAGAAETLSKIYFEETQFPSFRVQLRVNDVPRDFHQHEDSISLAFSQAGTICKSGDNKDEGEEYSTNVGEVILFDDRVWHKAPPYKKEWKESPRVNLLI